jgi:hypothetical protein
MKITFQDEKLKFKNVLNNQFFVSIQGALWQKVHSKAAHMVCNSHGVPYTEGTCEWDLDDEIVRLIPFIEKIDF